MRDLNVIIQDQHFSFGMVCDHQQFTLYSDTQ